VRCASTWSAWTWPIPAVPCSSCSRRCSDRGAGTDVGGGAVRRRRATGGDRGRRRPWTAGREHRRDAGRGGPPVARPDACRGGQLGADVAGREGGALALAGLTAQTRSGIRPPPRGGDADRVGRAPRRTVRRRAPGGGTGAGRQGPAGPRGVARGV